MAISRHRAQRWTAASVRAALKVIRIEDEAEIAAQAAEIAPSSLPDLVSLTAEELEYLRESLELGGYEG